MHGLRDMVDHRQAGSALVLHSGSLEFDVPHARKITLWISEIDQASAETSDSRNLKFPWSDCLSKRHIEQLLGPIKRRRCILDLEAYSTNRRSMRDVERMRKTLLFRIHNNVDLALVPPCHRLRDVYAGLAETQSRKQALKFRRTFLVNGELDKFGAEALGARWQFGLPLACHPALVFHLIKEIDEGSASIYRHAAGRSGAELVVENLERKQAVVAGRRQRPHKVLQRKPALTRKIAVVSAPREIIHVEQRGVCNLHQENAVAGDGLERAQIGLPAENMKRVQHDADGWMVGATHHFPRVAIVIDMTSPGQRLEPDPQTAFDGDLAKLMQIGSGTLDSPQAFW